MKHLLNIILFFIILAGDLFADVTCKKNEIHVKGHSVSSYETRKGKIVSAYFRDEYCRKSKFSSKDLEFGDKQPPNWKNKDEHFKAWNDEEIGRIFKYGDESPPLLRNQKFKGLYRGEKSIYPGNPATTLPSEQVIIFYDDFFKRKDSLRVFGHELGHLLYWQLDSETKKEFSRKSGWKFDSVNGTVSPPKNPIYDDSLSSPSEDFANNIEAFYFDKNHLRKNNPDLFNFMKKLQGKAK